MTNLLFSLIHTWVIIHHSGKHWLELLDGSVPLFGLLLCGLSECLAVSRTVGVDSLINEVWLNGHSVISFIHVLWQLSKVANFPSQSFRARLLRHLWLWFIPVILSMSLLAAFVNLIRFGFGDFPAWAVVTGVVLAIGTAAPIPLFLMLGGVTSVVRPGRAERTRLDSVDGASVLTEGERVQLATESSSL